MVNNNEIQLMSNVKIITTGNKPTTANLLPGQAAFGKINEDNKYHLFGNTGEGGGAGKVVDIVVDTVNSAVKPTLENVLTNGNTTKGNNFVIQMFTDDNSSDTANIELDPGTGLTVSDGVSKVAEYKKDKVTFYGNADLTKQVSVGFDNNGEGYFDYSDTTNNKSASISSNAILISSGSPGSGTFRMFKVTTSGVLDNTEHPLLTSNPEQSYSNETKIKFRSILDVLSSSETKALISGVYKVKGSVASFNALVTNETYTPEVGDVWNIEAAGGQDSHGQDIKAGDNIVFVGPNKATDWDILAGVIDLSGYYTKTDVDKIKENLQSEVTAAKAAADAAQATANAAQTAADAAKSAADAISADYVKETEFNTKAETAFDGFVTTKHVVTDAAYVHTDNNYTSEAKTKVDKLDFSGDGSKVLTDDGSVKTLNFSIFKI